MRFVSLDISNYRLIKDLHIDFDEGLNLIGGPNESGKSTVVEALHRVLFVKSNSTADVVKAMNSKLHPGMPQVRLEFELGGRAFVITKKFGQKGSTRLESEGRPTLDGTDADDEMKRLLDIEVASVRSQVEAKWRHLWIWQGQGFQNPVQQIGEVSSKLEERLSNMVDGLAVRSEIDRMLQERFVQECEDIFKEDRKKYKAESKAFVAGKQVEEAEKKMKAAKEAWHRLEDFATRLPALIKERNERDRKIDEFKGRQNILSRNSEELNRLNTEKALRDGELRMIEAKLTELAKSDRNIGEFRSGIENARLQTGPFEAKIRDKELEINSINEEYASAEAGNRKLDVELGDMNNLIEPLRLFLERRRIGEEIEKLRTVIEKASEARRQLDEVAMQLGSIPALDEALVDGLAALHRNMGIARASLDSIATEVKLEDSDARVELDGVQMVSGVPRIVTAPSHINIGKGIRILINPGGGTRLSEARLKLEKLGEEWTSALAEAGVESLEEAKELLFRRNQIKNIQLVLQTSLDGMDAENTRQRLIFLEQDYGRVEAKLSFLKESFNYDEYVELPEEPLRRLLEEKDNRRRELQKLKDDAIKSLERASKRLENSRRELADDKNLLAERENEIKGLNAKITFLEEEFGSDADRKSRLRELSRNVEEARKNAEEIKSKIDALDPTNLAMEMERVQKAIEESNALQEQIGKRIIESELALNSDGYSDPEKNLQNAETDLSNAKAAFDSEKLKADAVALLADLYREGHKERTEAFIKPLSGRIVKYLELLYGKGVHVELEYDKGGFSGLSVSRSMYLQKMAVDFDDLSGGTREQFAAAVRLAIAEVLSETTGGRIPIVLDDAFVNTDLGRIEGVQSMLYHAHKNGVQVIVLSCAPNDYSSLGARTTLLEVPVARQ
jgi:DNA repair exonuclease SbcCD ATPase subunit